MVPGRVPGERILVQLQELPPGSLLPGWQRAKAWVATYKVNHDEVIMGIATASPTGTIRMQAALERRLRIRGVRGIHLFQDKAESAAAPGKCYPNLRKGRWCSVAVMLLSVCKPSIL